MRLHHSAEGSRSDCEKVATCDVSSETTMMDDDVLRNNLTYHSISSHCYNILVLL